MGKQSNAWPIYWEYGQTTYYEEDIFLWLSRENGKGEIIAAQN
jgi:hypothetical protein